MNYALHQALAVAIEEGLAARFERHVRNSAALLAGLTAIGFQPFAQEGHRLPMLNSVYLPAGVEDAEIRRRLLDDYDIEIGGGLGELAGRIWRIGLMGESCRRTSVLALLNALDELIEPAVSGGATAAAEAAYGEIAAEEIRS